MKRLTFKLAAAAVLSSVMMIPTFAKDITTLKILHTNDIHGNVKDNGSSKIGFAKFATFVEEARQEENLLVLDAGDMFQGVPFANLEKGTSIIALANAVGYDAMTVGNHEFDFGAEHLFNNIISQLNFPMIAANVYKGEERALEPYIIKEVEGVKVGIFGMATEETAFKSHPSNTIGYHFADMIEEATEIVDVLKNEEQAEVIIMLSHLGINEGEYTSDLIAKAVDGIDVIVDGHSHTELPEGLQIEDTLIVSTGSAFNNVGEVELVIEEGQVVSKEASLLDYSAFENVIPNQEVLDTIAKVEEGQKVVLEKQVGTAKVDLIGERTAVRTGETNLGQLAADAMLDLTGAQVALTNGGGIRASIKAGPITMNDMVTVFPYGNTIMVKSIKGSDIKAALEHGVSEYPNEKGAFPHTAGITFTLNAYKEVGQRIDDLKINGQPIQMDAMYTVATNDFLAVGGDGYEMLKAYPIQAEYNTLMDTLLDYIEKLGTVEGSFEPRMKVITEAPVSNEVVISILEKSITKGGESLQVGLFPYIEEGRVMARLRDMSNLLDIEVMWNHQAKTATIKGTSISFKVGEDFARIEGEKVDLGVTTKIVENRVHLPVAQIARLLKRDVSYQHTNKKVVIA